jgi:uncharacterized protein (TIGR03118 family)
VNHIYTRVRRGSFAPVAVLTLAASGMAATSVSYRQVDLVTDQPHVAPFTDAALVNGWGLAIGPGGLTFVADNHTGMASIFTPDGFVVPIHIQIPSPPGSSDTAAPTGLVLNPTNAFLIVQGGQAHPASLLFATENGTIAGWSVGFGTPNAFNVVDSTPKGSIYKGLARGHVPGGERLYATDFHNGRVDVFDQAFQPVNVMGAFLDPALPANYVPFGIQEIDDHVFVTYAFRAMPDDGDETAGAGLGLVSVFQNNGTFVRRFTSNGDLNAPWGVTVAPAQFGPFSHALLVGNFGDGRITAFDRITGATLGQLSNSSGTPLQIEGLWGLDFSSFGNPRLYFAAGPDDEKHGLFGFVRAEPH